MDLDELMKSHAVQDNFLKTFKEKIGFKDINKSFESSRMLGSDG
jgi:hypothetical protein